MLKRKKKSYRLPGSTEIFISTISQASVKKKFEKSSWTPFLGFFYTFMSSLTVLLSSVFVKKLTYISPGQLSMVRNIAALFGSFPIALCYGINILGPKNFFWLLSIRAVLGATALYLNLIAYRLLPLPEASIILASVPVLVTLVARVHLKEPCGCVHVLSLVLTTLGVLTSIRLPRLFKDKSGTHFSRDYIIGLTCQFGCVLTMTFMFVSLRRMQNVHFSVILFYFGLLGVVENAIITTLFSSYSWPRCGGWDNLQVLLMGVFGFLGNCFMTLAIQREMASIVTTSKAAIDIVVSSLFQYLFFDSLPDIYTLSGGLLVIFTVGSLGFYKWVVVQPENSVYKKRFKYLLL